MTLLPENFEGLPKEEQARIKSSLSSDVIRVNARTFYKNGYEVYKHSVKGTSCECKYWMFEFSRKNPKDDNPRCKHIDEVRRKYPEILDIDPKGK